MKKLLSIILAFSIILGMTVAASAATMPKASDVKIRKISSDFQQVLGYNATGGFITIDGNKITSVSTLADLEVTPGAELRIYLTAGMFLDANSQKSGDNYTRVPYSSATSGKVAVRTSVANGSGAMKVTLEGDNKTGAYIKVLFSKSPEFDGKKFSYSVFLSVNGVRNTTTRIPIKGIIQSEVFEVDSYDDYFDLSGGASIKATETIRNMELYLGEGLTIVRNLSRNKTYSGSATTDLLDKDEETFMKYDALEYIYRITSSGLKAEGNIVYFDLDDKFYVYNTNGAYIGTSDKALPFWTKYYLTTKKYESIQVA